MKKRFEWFKENYQNGFLIDKINFHVKNINCIGIDRMDIFLHKPIQTVSFLKFIIKFSEHFDYHFTIKTNCIEFLDLPF